MFPCCHPGTFSRFFFIGGCNIEDHDFVKRYNTRTRSLTVRPKRDETNKNIALNPIHGLLYSLILARILIVNVRLVLTIKDGWKGILRVPEESVLLLTDLEGATTELRTEKKPG